MPRSSSLKREANTQKDVKKSRASSKPATYVVPVKIPGVVKGLTVAPAKSWTAPNELINSINGKNLLKHDTEDLYNKLLNGFYQLSHAVDISIDVKTYAKKCYGYAANKSFKSKFIEVASSKKDIAEKAEVDQGVSRLAKKGKMKASNIIDTLLNVIADQVHGILQEGDSSDESTSDSSQEKLPSDLSMDHHPLRINMSTLYPTLMKWLKVEEEMDNEEDDDNDWIVDNIPI